MTATIYVDPQAQEHGLEAYMLIRHINSMLDTFNRYDLRGEDLTVPQFAILNHATAEGVPLSDISARMLCDNSNLTGIVDRLIAKGLVERRPDHRIAVSVSFALPRLEQKSCTALVRVITRTSTGACMLCPKKR